jgi:hypothetical protein
MGRRERHLREIVSTKYTVIETAENPSQMLLDALEQSPHNKGIIEIYKSECTNQATDKGLGGMLGDYPREPGKWDISVQEGFRIELDEEQHFNRYREITLNSRIYEREKIISPEQLKEYKRFCAEYEHRCPHTGGWWSNPSANMQFGMASMPRVFDGNGSSRWKQRAFYDFLKDVASLVEGKPLIRISVYDTVCVNGEWKSIGKLLELDRYMDYAQGILDLVEKRLEWWKGRENEGKNI